MAIVLLQSSHHYPLMECEFFSNCRAEYPAVSAV